MFSAIKYISCVFKHTSGQNFLVTLNATFKTVKVQDILTKVKGKYLFISDINVTSTGKSGMLFIYW